MEEATTSSRNEALKVARKEGDPKEGGRRQAKMTLTLFPSKEWRERARKKARKQGKKETRNKQSAKKRVFTFQITQRIVGWMDALHGRKGGAAGI